MVVRTDPVPFIARETLDLKIPAIESPLSLIGGRLLNYALYVGPTLGHSINYHVVYIGHQKGQRVVTMSLKNPRAQRGLKILAEGDDAIRRVSEGAYKVKSQSGKGYYDVVNDGVQWVCSCPDRQVSGQFCKHQWAVELSIKIRLTVEDEAKPEVKVEPIREVPECPRCGAKEVIRVGVRACKRGGVQRFECKPCGKRFIIDNGFSRIRVSPRAAVTAFDLWAKKVSYRQIAHHLKDIHGIDAGKSTIERWVRRMAKLIALYADKCAPKVGEVWHADETSVNIDGKLRWTWNVMDHETRFWLASTISEKREISDARRPLRKAKFVAGAKPKALITDGLHAYKEASRREFHEISGEAFSFSHFVIPPLRKVKISDGGSGGIHPGNNIVERLQGTQRERTKVMRGFDSQPTAQVLVDGYRGYYNLVRPHLGLDGQTPAEAAGVAVPEMSGEGRLMAALIMADRIKRRIKDFST
jgi:transposase-like protein/transcription elongation factor Elf1